uniref:Interleukin 11 receptor, alpha n=1 Tax=Tetraodon nigroviridis TaxID=99883 RepID=H3C7E1_TETNG
VSVSEVQFGRLDSNVTLPCGKSLTRTPVTWHLNNSSALPWHQVTSDGSLVLLQVDPSAQGDYSCWDSRGRLLHAVQLRLGHPPGLLNISCQVPSYMHVRCSWVDTVKTFLPSEYTTSLRGKDSKPCIVDAVRKHCDILHPAIWQRLHVLSVTETNGLGSKTSTLYFKLRELLKPDPPESVSVGQIVGFSDRLMVSWNIPSSWPQSDAFQLVFHIRYRPLGSRFWSEFYSMDNPVVISDALAGHLHQVQGRSRDEVNNESQWSDWSPLQLEQPWEGQTGYVSAEPEILEQDMPTFQPKPDTSTARTHLVSVEEEGNLGLVIVLVLLLVVVLATVLSLILVVWFRQRRRDHVSMQEVASVVKMKSVPI